MHRISVGMTHVGQVNDMIHTVETAVRAIQRQYRLFPQPAAEPTAVTEPTTVIVGVSGGADSVCLLHLLWGLADEWRLALHVAHLDHALRPESAADAEFVGQLAAKWGLPFHHRRLAPGALTNAAESVETAARNARRQFFAELAGDHSFVGNALVADPLESTFGAETTIKQKTVEQEYERRVKYPAIIALAHHADDQAETIIHHLVRGSGLHGLGGMQPVAAFDLPPEHLYPNVQLSNIQTKVQSSPTTDDESRKYRLVRPLLYVRRSTILQYLTAVGLTWREDPTNRDQQYTRNYIRHTVMPALAQINPAVVEAIGRMATVAQEERARLTAYDEETLARLQLLPDPAANPGATKEFVLDLDALRLLPKPTQRALLRMALNRLAPIPSDLGFAQLDTLVAALETAGSGGPYTLLGNLAWSVAGATDALPTRLSLHHVDTLPFVHDQLLLPVGQQIALPVVPLGEHVQLDVAEGYALQIRHIAYKELPADWRQADAPWRAFLDADRVGRLVLTTPVAGQQFAPLGMGGHHKLVGDCFTDRKIPVALRMYWPLVVDAVSDTLLWICGLQVGHTARITDQTRQVLALSLHRK